MTKAGTGEISFGAGVDLVIAMPLSWLPLIADYTRLRPHARRHVQGQRSPDTCLANIWFHEPGRLPTPWRRAAAKASC